MIKKSILLLLCSLFTHNAAAIGQWPLAAATPFVLPLLTGNNQLIDSVLDGLNFDFARELSCHIQLPKNPGANPDETTAPVEIAYNLRWGYKGAGDATQPFAGIKGTLNIGLNYDGISFQLCKSQSLKKKIRSLLKPLTLITPCQEFYFKVAQLAWTVSQQVSPDTHAIKVALQTLVSRLKLTPGGAQCSLYTMPILSSSDRIGLETYLEQAPQQCVAQFILLSHKGSAIWTLLTGAQYSADRAAYINAILSQINYYHETESTITLPSGGWIAIPCTGPGSGDVDAPFTPITLTMFAPASETIAHPTEFSITLRPEDVFVLKLLMLLIHNRKSPLPSHIMVKEISALCSRMTSTPLPKGHGQNFLRTAISMLCTYHQAISDYSFTEPLDHVLSSEELLLQLCRVAYHAYVLSNELEMVTPQDTADFITVHTADALRCYEGIIAIRTASTEKARIAFLDKKGVQIKWDLFAKTLLGPIPGE